MTQHNDSIIEALEAYIPAIPGMAELQREYRVYARGLPDADRLRWVTARMSPDMVAELADPKIAETVGVTQEQLAAATLDHMLNTWTTTGSASLASELLKPQVHRDTLPDGTPYLLASIHQYTDLEQLFDLIRTEYNNTFVPLGVSAKTVRDVVFVTICQDAGMRLTDIAWEFVYRDDPEAQGLDFKERKGLYGD